MATNAPTNEQQTKQHSVIDILDFFMYVGQLKTAKRTGWTHHNVHHVESVSDHMYRMAMMTMLLNNNQLDTTRCMKLALVHDLAECITGDITPYCGVSEEEKFRREKEAMVRLTGLVPNASVAEEMMGLWEEYARRESAEAKAVKDLDRFEMILQAYEYEKAERRCGDLEKFFSGVQGKFEREDVKEWVAELHKRRGELRTNQDRKQEKSSETEYLDCN